MLPRVFVPQLLLFSFTAPSNIQLCCFQEVRNEDNGVVRGCDGQHSELHRAAHSEDSLDAARADADMYFHLCSRVLHCSGQLIGRNALPLPKLSQLCVRLAVAAGLGGSAGGGCSFRRIVFLPSCLASSYSR